MRLQRFALKRKNDEYKYYHHHNRDGTLKTFVLNTKEWFLHRTSVYVLKVRLLREQFQKPSRYCRKSWVVCGVKLHVRDLRKVD